MDVIIFTLLGFGFLSGIRHAFDADHIAAVSTMVSKHKSVRKSSLLGMFWGFGHAISLFVIGLIILLLKITIPKKIVLSLELIVGIMLVILGVNSLFIIKRNKIHFHKHKHGKEEHTHFHSHKLEENHNHAHAPLKQSLFIGVIHGLAGSAALTLLVLATVKSFWIGITYIFSFGLGSIMGMMLISSIISLPFLLISNKFQTTQKLLSISSGFISAVIGLTIIYNIGVMSY